MQLILNIIYLKFNSYEFCTFVYLIHYIMKAKTKILKKINLFILSKKLLLTFITFFLLTSCSNNEEVESSSFTPQNIPFTLIGKNFMYSTTNIPVQNTIITNQTQWTNLVNQMYPQLNGDTSFTTSNIDFNNNILIAIIDIDGRPNTSYSIAINSITENENNIVVDVSTTGSMNGFNAGTQPFHIVKIPIQSKPFVFQ